MMVVPGVTPFTIPRLQFTVATAVLLLYHKPPGAGLLITVVRPTHTVVIPVLEKRELTAITVVEEQPVPMVYDMVEVPPNNPLTIPVVPTEAIVGLLLDQMPPDVASARAVVEP